MNEPLALLLCARGLISTQVVQRLEALRYRVVILARPVELVARTEQEMPMVVLVDVDGDREAVLQAIEQLRARAVTAHVPVIGFVRELDDAMQTELAARGATFAVSEAAVLNHLEPLLDRALEIH